MIDNEELEKMFAMADKFLVPYRNGIAEGKIYERERIIKVLRDAGYPESTIALIEVENK